MARFLLHKLGFVTKQEGNASRPSTVMLWGLEELMFWGGFFLLLTGIGWVSWAGGFLILASIVLAFALLN